MNAGDCVIGALIGLSCFMFGKHEDKVYKLLSEAKEKFLTAKSPEAKKKIAKDLAEDPTLQELFKLMGNNNNETKPADKKNTSTNETKPENKEEF